MKNDTNSTAAYWTSQVELLHQWTAKYDWKFAPVRGKSPAIAKGDNWYEKDYDLVEQITQKHCDGIAVKLGSASNGLMACEFDGQAAIDYFDANYPLLPKTIASKSRDGNEAHFYKIPEGYELRTVAINAIDAQGNKAKYINANGEEKESRIELRIGTACQHIPPTIHIHTGNPYQWINSPENTELAIAPDWMIALMIKPVYEPRAYTPTINYGSNRSDSDRAREYLQHCDHKASNYQDWIAVGWRLRSVSDDLFSDFVDWSARFENYQGEKDCWQHWKSFDRLDDIDKAMGTLANWAKSGGWVGKAKLQKALNPIITADLRYTSKIEEPSEIALLSLLPKKYIEAVKYGIDSPLTHITTVKGLAVATEAYLISKSIKFDGNAKDIFSQFCQNQDDSIEADFNGSPFDKEEKIDTPSIKKLLDVHESEQQKLRDRIERERVRTERELARAESESKELCSLAENFATINGIYGDRLKLNTLTNEAELDGEFVDFDRLRLKLALDLNIELSKSDSEDIFRAISESNKYHPVRDYLDGCYKKHGSSTNILSALASKCFGSSDSLYEIFLQKTLIAAVARIYDPACKVDSVLCLVGKQGYQKSSFFEALAGTDNFTDNLDKELTNKDNLMRLHRKWICEIGEIDRVSNSRYEGDLKNFITIKADLMRLPFARTTKEYKRGFLFVGSSNRSDFLTDPTGDRRYWLIPVAKKIDADYIKENRDLIWAAAVSLYKAGANWWLSELEKEASDRNNERYRSDSPWMPLITDFCERREKVSITEILHHIEGDASRHTNSMQRDVLNCLLRLGFTKSGGKHRINIDGRPMTVNSWLAPTISHLGGSLGGSSLDTDAVSDSAKPVKTGGSLGGSSFDADVASNSEEMIHLIHQKQEKTFVKKNIYTTQENPKTDAYIFEEKSLGVKTLDHVDHAHSNVITAPKNDDPLNDPLSNLGGSSGSYSDDEWIDIPDHAPVIPTRTRKKSLDVGDVVRYVGQKFTAQYGGKELIVNSVGNYEIDCKLPDGGFTTKFKIHDCDLELVE